PRRGAGVSRGGGAGGRGTGRGARRHGDRHAPAAHRGGHARAARRRAPRPPVVTDELDLPSLLRAAELAARDGGEIVAAQFGSTGNARQKAPGDWVSDLDTTSEAAVRAGL